jgi:guanylate kinase
MSNNPHGRTRGLLLMVVAPSGVGKTSLTRRLVADHNDLHLSISATTRDPRPGEHDGRDYHFVSHDKFKVMIQDDAFLEWAEVYGNHYGSPRGRSSRRWSAARACCSTSTSRAR